MCQKIYKNINNNIDNSVILAPHNREIDNINAKILDNIQGESKIYYSVDSATYKGVDKSDNNIYLKYPMETLNKIKEGLPPHKLELKVNAHVILLRTLGGGLCNGSRLEITKLFNYNIEATVLTGDNIGAMAFIPRITSDSGNYSPYPFILYRKQFPIKLAFAISINKAQGQSFYHVGLFISRPIFSHGQLYVALSRGRNPKNIYIQNELEDPNTLTNIVWPEVVN